MEKLVGTLLALTAVNFLVVFIAGGYKLTIGPFQVSAYHLRNPLLLLLGFAVVKVWLRGQRIDIPIATRLRSPWLMFLAITFIYSLNGKTLGSPDNLPARYLPLSILREFNLDLNEFPFLHETGLPHSLTKRHEHIISTYPPGAAVLALPVYLLPVFGGISPESPLLLELEKLAATLITALSVLLLFFAMRQITQEKIAWFIALIYAFGTSSFNISSQSLWQHGPSQLFLTLMVYCLMRGMKNPKFSAYAGFALGSAMICRPLNIVVALPVVGYMLLQRRAQLIGFLLSALPPLLLFMGYNRFYFDAPFATGFASMVIKPSSLWTASARAFDTPWREGLVGVLASPSRGLLIYSPIFLFSFVGMVMVWRNCGSLLLKCLSLAPFLFILPIAKWATWWGGSSYGPRLLADITPILCLYLVPPLERYGQKTLLRYAFAGLAALSIGFHGVGAFSYHQWPGDLWSWVDHPPGYYGWQVITAARRTFLGLQRRALAMPTSLSAPDKLAASYDLIGLTPGPTLFPAEVLTVQLRAHNRGEAVWLADVNGHKGTIYLQSRWFSLDQEIPDLSGGESLQYDVFPGQSYEFTASLTVPREPGEYTVELGLVNAQITRLSECGIEPLKVGVRVFSPPSVDFNRLVIGQLKPISDPPRVAISTGRSYYKRGEFLQLVTDFTNPGVHLRVDGYLALSWPQGWLSFHAASQRFWAPERAWMPLFRRIFLPMGVQHAGLPIFTLKLDQMPPGSYTWNLVLTEPETNNVIARAQASFALEP